MGRFSWIILVGLVITRILLGQRGRQEGQRWRGNDRSRDQGGDAVSMALKVEEGTLAKASRQPPGARKGRRSLQTEPALPTPAVGSWDMRSEAPCVPDQKDARLCAVAAASQLCWATESWEELERKSRCPGPTHWIRVWIGRAQKLYAYIALSSYRHRLPSSSFPDVATSSLYIVSSDAVSPPHPQKMPLILNQTDGSFVCNSHGRYSTWTLH